jgi:Flp pilus assembly protein TadD
MSNRRNENRLPALGYADLAWHHFSAGQHAEARRLASEILRSEPQNPDALHLLGVLAYQANDQDEAIRLIGAAIKVHKHFPPMHGNLALAKLAAADLNGAKASARRALALKPSYADAHRVMGIVLHKQGRHRESIVELRRAIALDSDTAELRGFIGNALQALGEEQAAAAELAAAALLKEKEESDGNLRLRPVPR